MNITLQKPFSFSEIGKRLNNEDSIYPDSQSITINDRLFLICHGVGGLKKGEVASSITCDSIQTYFRTFLDTDKPFNPDFIEKSIRYTEIRFDEYVVKNPFAKGMATTLCLLYFAPDGIFLTYAGDSRIYQFRKGEIIFKTEDHSLVNSMVKTGQLTQEAANRHPQKNLIYRSIQGSRAPVELEIIKITDVLPNDEFFMCTNGVTEALNDEILSDLFATNNSAEKKINTIRDICKKNAKDNYSAYLIPILDIEKMGVFKQIYLYAFIYFYIFAFLF
jgi:protein phosphatase